MYRQICSDISCQKLSSLESLLMKTRVILDIFRYVIWTYMCVQFVNFCFLCAPVKAGNTIRSISHASPHLQGAPRKT